MSKIALITNRGIRGEGKRKGHTLLKNKLKRNDDPLRCLTASKAEGKRWVLDLAPVGENADFLQQLAGEDNGKKWLIFVHGNNKTAKQNLNVCQELAENYDVNVLGFSWPSVHYGRIVFWLGFLPLSGGVRYITRQVARKKVQYHRAQKTARSSTQHLREALALINSHFIPYLPGSTPPNPPPTESRPSILFHSMGNYLLENTVSDTGDIAELASSFKTIVLHQADCENVGHAQWVDQLSHSQIHITANEKDLALKSSNFANHNTFGNRRLGNIPNPPGTSSAHYRDWTQAHDRIGGTGHRPFAATVEEAAEVHNYFRELLT